MVVDLFKVTKYEGDDKTLVWKYPYEDFNTKSQLIVHQSQTAAFYKDGKIADMFGPGKYELTSENLPILNNFINIPTGGVSPFHCELYFINKATALNVEWGTSSRFPILDAQFNIPITVGASGSMELKVKDDRKFLIEVVGTQDQVDTEKLKEYFRNKMITRIKTYLAKLMEEVSYFNVTAHLDEISDAIRERLKVDFDQYGIDLINFYISNVIIPKEDTEKLENVLNKKMEYGTLGFNWADEQLADISKKYASNEGMASDVNGMITGIPLALAFGEMLKDGLSNNISETFTGKSENFGPNQNAEENGANTNTVSENPQKENAKFCSECGKPLKEGALFCSNCGAKVIEERKCKKCGYVLEEGDKFCSHCGTKVE
jgi:membrane protease subunit (stomatin/prohibitin family)